MTKTTAWRIQEMRPSQFSKVDPTSVHAQYSWKLGIVGTNGYSGSGCDYGDVVVLMRAFDVKEARHLEGMTFDSIATDPGHALDLLIKSTLWRERFGTPYVPPSRDELIDRAAAALAFMQQPSFSDVDNESVAEAFREAYMAFTDGDDWFKVFQWKVQYYSCGETTIERPSIRVITGVMGPATALVLKRDKRSCIVVFGPYTKPFTFGR